jgi:hypothetical protein
MGRKPHEGDAAGAESRQDGNLISGKKKALQSVRLISSRSCDYIKIA